MALHHSIRAIVLVAAAASVGSAQQPGVAPSTFTLFLRSTQIGTEQVSVTRGAEGWAIESSGRTGPPLDLVTRSLAIRYDAAWRPLELSLDATARGQALGLRITIAGTTATTHMNNAGQPTDRADAITPETVLLPNPFFAGYEAVTPRLMTAEAGATIPIYQGGPTPVVLRVGESSTEQIQTVSRLIQARRTSVTLLATPGAEVAMDLWGDETGRLLRVSIPGQSLEYARDDVASVSTRRVVISRAGDEQVQVPANGFNLAGTLSKPTAPAGTRSPAIVLVGGSGPLDRDETVAGIPVFGQLAGALADAGFAVLRYDKRGVGQSGGRNEAAGLADYADDLRAAVKFLSERKDIDNRRITVAGHSEGGAAALIDAARNNKVAALVLMSAPGQPGADMVLAQQRHLLDRSNLSDADRQAKIDLQKRINDAVIAGSGWDRLPSDVRRQVDNPEFQSILTFDPAKVVPRVRQPILIVQGALDTEVEPANADRLEALAKARKRQAPVELVKVPGVNHFFIPATTGEVAEYVTLREKQVTPDLALRISDWLKKTLPRS